MRIKKKKKKKNQTKPKEKQKMKNDYRETSNKTVLTLTWEAENDFEASLGYIMRPCFKKINEKLHRTNRSPLPSS
jgi:hypothetical protein